MRCMLHCNALLREHLGQNYVEAKKKNVADERRTEKSAQKRKVKEKKEEIIFQK